MEAARGCENLILAIETGGTKIQLALGNAAGDIFYTYRTKVEQEKGCEGIWEQIVRAFPAMEAEAAKRGARIRRIGIGFGGPVETATGRALWSSHIEGWTNFPMTELLEKEVGIESYIFNDSNAAAYGEYRRGSGRGSRNFFYTNIGSGVGGGLILNGELFDGQGRGAAEFGKSYLCDPYYKGDALFKVCHIEDVCSGWGIQNRIRQDALPRSSVLWELCGHEQESITCEHWARGIALNDAYCLQLLEEEAEYFAIALSNVLCFYAPEIIAIGGGVSLIGEPLISRIRKYLKRYEFIQSVGSYRLVKSELDESVVLVGTLLLTARQGEPWPGEQSRRN